MVGFSSGAVLFVKAQNFSMTFVSLFFQPLTGLRCSGRTYPTSPSHYSHCSLRMWLKHKEHGCAKFEAGKKPKAPKTRIITKKKIRSSGMPSLTTDHCQPFKLIALWSPQRGLAATTERASRVDPIFFCNRKMPKLQKFIKWQWKPTSTSKQHTTIFTLFQGVPAFPF